MSVISFEEWKEKHAQENKKADSEMMMQESYGFDLCNFITDEVANSEAGVDYDYLLILLQDLEDVIAETGGYPISEYIQAYIAFRAQNTDEFEERFREYWRLEKERGTLEKDYDWWIEHFFWTFETTYPGFYASCASIFNEFFPQSAITYICEALEIRTVDAGNQEMVLSLFYSAKEVDEQNPICHYLIGSFYYEQQQWHNALIYFLKADNYEYYSLDPSFLFDCAWTAEQCGEYVLAESFYIRCIEADEMYPGALNNLGCLHLRLHNDELAYRDFMKAILLDLDGNLPYKNALTALQRQKKYKQADSFLEQHKKHFGSSYENEKEHIRLLADDTETSVEEESYRMELEEGESSTLLQRRRLSEFMVDRINHGQNVFGKELEVYKDENGYGCQYFLPDIGIIDLLLTDKDHRELYVCLCVDGIANQSDVLLLLVQSVAMVNYLLQKEDEYLLHTCLLCRDISSSARKLLKEQSTLDIEVFSIDLTLSHLKI